MSNKTIEMEMELPDNFKAVFDDIVTAVRQDLRKGGQLEPWILVGSADDRVHEIVGKMNNQADKEQWSTDTHNAVRVLGGKLVIMVTESWGLPASMVPQHFEIIEKYGSIGNSPFKVDCISISLETEYGHWLGLADIKPDPPSKFRRKLGELKIIPAHYSAGLFGGFIPKLDIATKSLTQQEAGPRNGSLVN
jgi:hypothetical protein